MVIAERFGFHKRNQKVGESVSDFCVAIQKLSEHCQFGTTLNDALRDRLVCSLASENIQRKLLIEADLTYERAKNIAIAAETATKDAEELRKPMPTEVNKMKAKRPSTKVVTADGKASVTCSRCGRKNHDQTECYFRDKICHKCNKKGHTKKMCRSKPLNPNCSKKRVNCMEEETHSDSDDCPLNFVEISTLNSHCKPHCGNNDSE